MNKENLKRMADYIVTIPQEKFNMIDFRDSRNNIDRVSHKCNSVGCVIGHCTILDDWDNIPKLKNGEIYFGKWSEQFTGLDPRETIGINEWDWCFSNYWAGIDNTPIGASKRIMWLIENGLPEDAWKQMIGRSKLCYI